MIYMIHDGVADASPGCACCFIYLKIYRMYGSMTLKNPKNSKFLGLKKMSPQFFFVKYCGWFRNPANQLRLVVEIPLFTRFYTSQVVQDIFHQQYLQQPNYCPTAPLCSHTTFSRILHGFFGQGFWENMGVKVLLKTNPVIFRDLRFWSLFRIRRRGLRDFSCRIGKRR